MKYNLYLTCLQLANVKKMVSKTLFGKRHL